MPGHAQAPPDRGRLGMPRHAQALPGRKMPGHAQACPGIVGLVTTGPSWEPSEATRLGTPRERCAEHSPSDNCRSVSIETSRGTICPIDSLWARLSRHPLVPAGGRMPSHARSFSPQACLGQLFLSQASSVAAPVRASGCFRVSSPPARLGWQALAIASAGITRSSPPNRNWELLV